ncbi:hypothetical protein SLS59_008124 [Nothophoma quercina]|uniref:PIN-like protein n=1 Tax=Nothophoma quercina TaxID=749835 RepID=A0ABR3QVU8_9PLEO
MPAPPGVAANFDNPESIAHRVIIISVLGAVFAIPICLVRLYTKRRILRNFGWDDSPKFYALMKIGDIAGPILFNLATMFTKISLGLFYLRVSPVCVVSLIRVEQVVRGMKIVPTDGTWGMVANFIWL